VTGLIKAIGHLLRPKPLSRDARVARLVDRNCTWAGIDLAPSARGDLVRLLIEDVPANDKANETLVRRALQKMSAAQ